MAGILSRRIREAVEVNSGGLERNGRAWISCPDESFHRWTWLN